MERIRSNVYRSNRTVLSGVVHGLIVSPQKYHPYLPNMLQRPFIIIGTIIVLVIFVAPFVIGLFRRMTGRSPKE
jgi:hypothetical protein